MAAFPEDLFFATVSELGTRLRAREFSAAELVRAFSDRIEKLGPRYNALALSLRADAIKQAKAADDRFRHRPRGPLEGIPYGVKDLLAVSDRPTTWGALPLAGQTFPDDAAVIHSLDKAGAALIAKLALVELAGAGGYRSAAASMFGPGLNPWDRTRWAGGSSSGSAAAVAAGLVPFALGSETWGSIGVPCAYCGVTGLRPTYGLVSRQGAMPVAWTMDKIGPIGRSAEDCGLVLHAISGGDTGDPGSAGKRFYYWAPYAPDPKQLRIGFAPADYSDWAEAAARPAFEAALDAIRATGVQMRRCPISPTARSPRWSSPPSPPRPSSRSSRAGRWRGWPIRSRSRACGPASKSRPPIISKRCARAARSSTRSAGCSSITTCWFRRRVTARRPR